MFSILNKVFPSLKIRLIILLTLMLTTLSGVSLSLIYMSISKEMVTDKIYELTSRYGIVIQEYQEELDDDDDDHHAERSSRKAKREFKETLEDVEEVFKTSEDWVYLTSPDYKHLSASQNAPDLKLLQPSLKSLSGDQLQLKDKGLQNNKEFIYILNKMSDGNFILFAADMTKEEAHLKKYRNNLVLAFIGIVFFGILLFTVIINSSLKGFQRVREAADSIAEGNYEQRVETSKAAGAEVQELSTSFNNMIDKTQILLTEIKEVSNNVAHDLRTPITRIRGMVDTTLMAAADLKEHQEVAGVVIEECDKMMLLIDDILTLAQYESGLVKQKEEKINIQELLKNLCGVFESVAEDRNQTIKLEMASENIFISGEKEKVQRSLSNLLDNALKYSPDNGKIIVSAYKKEGRLQIQFIDSGCGISDEDQSRIFERFYRVDYSRSTPGNGLGLNLAKAFIENHGGQLKVESEKDRGSCFEVLLPIS